MLILRSKIKESIEITGSGSLRLTVLKIEGKQIKLGFDGDSAMNVKRIEQPQPTDGE